jgi:hypothetical protein
LRGGSCSAAIASDCKKTKKNTLSKKKPPSKLQRYQREMLRAETVNKRRKDAKRPLGKLVGRRQINASQHCTARAHEKNAG